MTTSLTSPAAGARLLSNGRFFTLLTAAGTGYSSLGDCALTRWQGDPVEDADGYFVYLRDLDTGAFSQAGLTSAFDGIEVTLDVVVDADADRELRTLTLRNRSGRARRIEATSYLEVVLNGRAAEASHPAFSKLFVQTEMTGGGALLARRRPRGADESGVWVFHAAHGGADPQWETDRKRFLGRGRSAATPQALDAGRRLSGTVGNVLDPVLSLRRTLALDAGAEASICFVLGAAPTRADADSLAARMPDAAAVAARATAARREAMQRAGISGADAAQCEELAAAVLYSEPALRAAPEVQRRTAGAPGILADYGLPTDKAICLVETDICGDAVTRRMLAAARYWKELGLPLQVVLVAASEEWAVPGQPAGVLHAARVPRADLDRIACLARAVIGSELPTFVAPAAQPAVRHAAPQPKEAATPAELRFFNGYGGFSGDGTEYVVRMPWEDGSGLRRPPLPWTNVIANEQVGVIVSETGAGYTWSRNSREHRLTPWFNDPVRDPHGEAFYLRDEDTGAYWSPMPGPAPAAADYEAIHGFGYTRFEHVSHELEQECTVFVPRHDPVRIVRIALRNRSAHPRRLALFAFQQLVLGGTPAESGRHVVTRIDGPTLYATNRMAGPFADGVAVAAVLAAPALTVHASADRAAFIGPRASLAAPAALSRATLDGASGAGLDPCAAFQVVLTVAPGECVECAFLLGETTDADSARALAERYRDTGAVAAALDEVTRFWRRTVGAVQVTTPVPEIDLMVNGWLAYQNLSCRIWGRSAFYQSGGAIGYRDQLQDSSAMLYIRPEMTRRQVLLHAAHQFVEGDVLHWWHPAPLDKGLRTRFADDLLWLPWIAAFYIRSTGDYSVLDESAEFLTAPLLKEGEDEVFLKPSPSGQHADVYEHCCRALDRSLTKGAHGLPLFGTGDWNDGMNRVGREGKGESVWMGFFLYCVIGDFLPLCERRGDSARVAAYTAYRAHLLQALNDAGWDGEWYRRAFYDNGVVMGSKDSDECQIDALAQAWAVISGVASPERAAQALDAMEQRLVSGEDRLIRLLTPPFVDTPQDPGYIKGYVAGVRENGGQYTHAACWAVRAVAEAGRRERAAELLANLSPVRHARTPEEVAVYQVEPYVIAADIYGAEPHVGRGGWTWYTGSAGWMFRVALESVLGFTLTGGDTIRIKPVVPSAWPEFRIRYTLPDGSTSYEIRVRNGGTGTVAAARIDGSAAPVEQGAALLPLRADGAVHHVDIELA
ncbi:MAG TPA: hypothetical protein VFF16_19740 [Telluria sp.]|nr:hypothetical protein [Telluria sp.]